MKTDAWRGEAGGNGETGSRAGAGRICAPLLPRTPAPSFPGGLASESGAKLGVAPLWRETSLGSLNSDFFNKLQLIGRARGGVAGVQKGEDWERDQSLQVGRRVQALFACRHQQRLPRATGSSSGRRVQGRARPGDAEPAGRGPDAGSHGGCRLPSAAIHHLGPPEARWSGASPPRPEHPVGGGLMWSPRPKVLPAPCGDRGWAPPRGREPSCG